MSKPETPCHPDCYVGAGGSILHAPGCTKNAPKAEAPPKDEEDYLRGSRIPIADVRRIAPPAPVSEPPIDWKRVLKFATEYEDDWTPGDLPNASRAILSLIADNTALKAQLDTDREVLKETENNISNLAKFAASPITPNYNLPMSGLAIAIRDSLAAALGREILLTQEWDALKAQNATQAQELQRLRDLIVAPIEARLAFDSYSDSSTTTDAMWHALCNAKVRAVDALSDEGKAIRAAREAGKA